MRERERVLELIWVIGILYNWEIETLDLFATDPLTLYYKIHLVITIIWVCSNHNDYLFWMKTFLSAMLTINIQHAEKAPVS